MGRFTIPREELMRSGHVACQGCGAAHAMRYALKVMGPKTIVSIPACCWAVIPGIWPSRVLDVPLMYSAFEVTGASVSGIRAALDVLGRDDVQVMGWAGDGGTADIGIQALSGMVERGTDAIYVMYDNEAYMNTGIQRSSSTPVGAWTTTTPVGRTQFWEADEKKDMAEILIAHKAPYVATANIAYPEDMIRKFERAKEIRGPKFIQVFAPCPTGWRADPSKTIEIARMAVSTWSRLDGRTMEPSDLPLLEEISTSMRPILPVFWSSLRSSSSPSSPSVCPNIAPTTSGFSTTPSVVILAVITYFVVFGSMFIIPPSENQHAPLHANGRCTGLSPDRVSGERE